MKSVTLTDDVEGHKSGETVSVPNARAEFLLTGGYATVADENAEDYATAPKIKDHPMEARNAKDEPATPMREQVSTGEFDDLHEGEDPKPFLDRPDPVEKTNGKGDPEKAEAGKEDLEEEAVDQDPKDAPEEQGQPD